MTPFPSPEVLASLVSNVTSTMLGISFTPENGKAPEPTHHFRTALLPIPGKRPITVGISSDKASCHALAAAMFSVKLNEADQSMVDDAMRELLNMTAGLVKTTLALDQALGLPKIFGDDKPPDPVGPPESQLVLLRSRELALVLWVTEGIHF